MINSIIFYTQSIKNYEKARKSILYKKYYYKRSSSFSIEMVSVNIPDSEKC